MSRWRQTPAWLDEPLQAEPPAPGSVAAERAAERHEREAGTTRAWLEHIRGQLDAAAERVGLRPPSR